MPGTMRTLRRTVLSRLFDHLQDQYGLDYPRDRFVAGEVSPHEMEAVLAFKTDVHLDELRGALERMDAGTYGVCITCKRPISEEVLQEDPTQRVCPSCAPQYTRVLSDMLSTRVHALR